jgi:ABC-2 type transport system permease protein
VNEYLGYVIMHGEAVGRVMKTALYPFSQLGYACEGKGLALLLYALMFMGAFACVYFLVSATYLRLATAKKGNRKVKYTGKGYKGNLAVVAMMKKELLRYTKNGMVLLNAFMGTVFFILLPVVALFERETFIQLSQSYRGEFTLILAGILCVSVFSNFLAPSCISMEGASLDVIRVLPIRAERIFLAKGLANGVITGVPAVISSIFLCIIFKQSFLLSVCILLTVSVCVLLASAGGIAINLLLPNLKWTNEVAVIKQSASTLASMLGGMGAVALLVGAYFLFGKYLPVWGFLLICTAILFVGSVGTCIFLKKKGTRIFEEL